MRLSLETRGVGDVTIVRCSGRIVAGSETDLLYVHVNGLTQDRTDIVLHLGDLVFIDSSGLGMLVRLLISMRKNGGDLKLCNVPQDIHKVLKMTNLNTLFDMHESEEDAILSFTVETPLQSQRLARVPDSCAWIRPPTCSLTCVNCCGAPATTSLPIATCMIL